MMELVVVSLLPNDYGRCGVDALVR